MSVVKALRFPANVRWSGGRVTRVSAPGKLPFDVATPPEFRGGVEGVWSPEELLVAAAGSCFAVTLAAIAERSGVALTSLEVEGVGHVERGRDGRFGFVAVELTVAVAARAEAVTLERLARKAEELCIVSLALDVPVHVRLVTSAPLSAPSRSGADATPPTVAIGK